MALNLNDDGGDDDAKNNYQLIFFQPTVSAPEKQNHKLIF